MREREDGTIVLEYNGGESPISWVDHSTSKAYWGSWDIPNPTFWWSSDIYTPIEQRDGQFWDGERWIIPTQPGIYRKSLGVDSEGEKEIVTQVGLGNRITSVEVREVAS
jgi:hypothetical protein